MTLYLVLILCLVIYGGLALAHARAFRRYNLMYKNLLKQSFSMTIAVGEYHMWVQDHLENFLVQQVMNSGDFIAFAKTSGLSITKLEEILRARLAASTDYVKFQSKECLRKVSEPLAQDINEILEKQ